MRTNVMKQFLPVILVSLGLLSGLNCTSSVHLVSMSDFNPPAALTEGKLVESVGEQFTVMGFVSDTEYVDQALARLMAQCPDGHIKGILLRYSTRHGFFSWTNVVKLRGLCVGK